MKLLSAIKKLEQRLHYIGRLARQASFGRKLHFGGKSTLSRKLKPVSQFDLPAGSQPATPSLKRMEPNREPNPAVQDKTMVELPLAVIVPTLATEIRIRFRPMDFDRIMVRIPIDNILPQLSRGSITMPFADLYKALPQAFQPEYRGETSTELISLPLGEILSRIDSKLVRRRNSPKKLEVPMDIRSPFELEEETPAPQPEQPNPVSSPDQERTMAVTSSPGSNGAPTSATVASAASSPAASSPLVLIPSQAPETQNGSDQSAPSPTNGSSIEPVRPAGSSGLPKLIDLVNEAHRTDDARADASLLVVALWPLMTAWPPALQREIQQSCPPDAQVALPLDFVAPALKNGRVTVRWGVLRPWLRPIQPSMVSAHDQTELELPLKLIAPLCLARLKSTKQPRRKVELDESIPSVFTDLAAPASAPLVNPPSAAPASLPPKLPKERIEPQENGTTTACLLPESHIHEPQPKPLTKSNLPHEIVFRATALEGVTGAIIALSDGLVVASRLPEDFEEGVIAAFLPQIFSRLAQCTNELRLGPLSQLTFKAGGIPWNIFRTHDIFFAAFGRAGESMPTDKLANLAEQLQRKAE